ncbi:MAG: alpha/beta hydrolase, partial [Agrobacterium vaccinii]
MPISCSTIRTASLAFLLLSSSATVWAQQPAAQPAQQTPQAEQAKPDAQMQAVLDALKGLDAKPFSSLTVPQARTQASAADAAHTVQRDKKISPMPEAGVATTDIAIPSAAGALPARVYIPEGKGPFPVVLYFHGGGWVVADINTYDATPRALALGSKAIVVSADYHHAPESKFPAQHDDAWAA